MIIAKLKIKNAIAGILNTAIFFGLVFLGDYNMPESKENATARAKREGFDIHNVTKAAPGKYFIAPHGIQSAAAKKAYASARSEGKDKETSAKIAWTVENKK